MSSDTFERLRDDIKRGDVIAVRRFLFDGCDPNLQSAAGESALTVAAAVGQTRVVEVLLDAGANVNHHTNGWTTLYSSSMNGQRRTVEVLLKSGANAQVPMLGKSIAYWVSYGRAEYREILELLNAQAPESGGAA